MSDWKKVEQAEFWKPEKPNDSVEGIFVEVATDVGPNNSKLYTLEQEDGERISIWGSTVLDTRMKNVQAGEEVKILYKGIGYSNTRKGATYKDFEVYHRKPEDFNEEE